ncbi:CAP domain-containing protein [Nonomuraea sp. NPDC048916]|uniref:CAP domain-containing protein n=1 Tax=Nonomuraea sp. NPDC048916 TaxID=3154232 RepID=UPI0033E7998B
MVRGQFQALACLGSLAALSFPVPPAQAATIERAPLKQACQVVAVKPQIDVKGMIRGAAIRSGCDDRTRFRVRIKRVVPGPDRTVKSGSKMLTNGRIVAGVRCVRTPARYYVVALDYRGGAGKSGAVTLSCKRQTPPKSGGASAVEDTVVKLTNEARAAGGCRPLVHDPKLHAAAERHSADMAARGFFDHTSPDGRSPGDRVRAAGFAPISTWGENIAKGRRTAAQAVDGWLNSPGHRANIMNCAFTHIGVGHAATGPHWTQVFAAH